MKRIHIYVFEHIPNDNIDHTLMQMFRIGSFSDIFLSLNENRKSHCAVAMFCFNILSQNLHTLIDYADYFYTDVFKNRHKIKFLLK